MKLCIFAGTFNPIHNAHLKMSEFILNNYSFDKLLFIPAFQPPHKIFDNSISIDRYKMVELAIKCDSRFDISDIEFKNNRKSYTYLTILELYEKYQVDGKISVIIGTDAFEKIETWYQADKLKELVEFIIFVRQNEKVDFLHLREKGYSFQFATMDFVDISSTLIRKYVKNNQDISGLVPNNVKEYIIKNGLYRN